MPKKIDVNLSTLVDLKAELIRKQEQAQRRNQERSNESKSAQLYVKGKPILREVRKATQAQGKLLRQDPPSAERRRKIEELEAAVKEEERQLQKSKQQLEAKAALYEKLKSGRGEEDELDSDGKRLYLVNFDRKVYDEQRKSEDSDSSDEEDYNKPKASTSKADDDEDWVEYTDSLGRTRKCLRQDLPSFIEADNKLKSDLSERKPAATATFGNISEKSDLLSADMRRELQRRAWEKEEEEKISAPRGPVHYQHVAEGEARELGVAYYPFAADEKMRQDQMKLLDNLRQQTLSQRDRSQKLKEKRHMAMKARLDKVKERKRLKLDDGQEILGAESDSDDDDNVAIISNLQDIPLPPSAASTASSTTSKFGSKSYTVSKPAEIRPWDIGKPKVPREDWIENRRQDRSKEFAPPSFY